MHAKRARMGMAYASTFTYVLQNQTSHPLAAAEAAGARVEPRHMLARASLAGLLASIRLLVARGSSWSSLVNLGKVILHVPPSSLKV